LQAIITFFIGNGPMMMQTIKEVWYYTSESLAPIPWINLLALSLCYWRDNNKDMRHEKHAESQHRQCYNTKKGWMRQGSIRDYNLHSSNPHFRYNSTQGSGYVMQAAGMP
jgi:hypothetical protein